MEDIELKNCPFCNGNAAIEQQGTNRISTIYSCCDCGCRLETGETWQTPQRWNTRATDAQLSTLTAQLEEAREALEGMFDNIELLPNGKLSIGTPSVESVLKAKAALSNLKDKGSK